MDSTQSHPALWWLTRIAWALLFVNVLAFFLSPFMIWFEASAWILLTMIAVGPLLAIIALGIALTRRDRTYKLANLIVILAYAAWWGAIYMMLT